MGLIWHPTRNIAQAFECEKKFTSDEIWIRITTVHGYGYEITVFKKGIGKRPHRLENELAVDWFGDLAFGLSVMLKKAWETE